MVEAVLCMAFLMDILGIPVEMSRSTKMNEEKMREAMAEVKKKWDQRLISMRVRSCRPLWWIS